MRVIRRLTLLVVAALSMAAVALSGCNKGEDPSTRNESPQQKQERQDKKGD
jgi:hypothetical protein